MTNKPILALFDFDGTLTTRDSTWLYLRAVDPGLRSWWRFALGLPAVILKYGIHREQTKKTLIRAFLGGRTRKELDRLARDLVHRVLPVYINHSVMQELEKYRSNGARVIIVSASLDIWLDPFAEQAGVEVLCTQLDYADGIFRGAWRTPNCRSEEKVRRVRAHVGDTAQYHIVAFGNSKGDKEMLEMADEAWWVDKRGVVNKIISP